MPWVVKESHVLQQKAICSNRKPCVATENQIVATNSFLRQKKPCVATESHVWQQKAMCGNRKSCVATESHTWPQKSWVATESHGWQQKAAMCGNRKPGKCYYRKPTFLPSEANLSMWHKRQPARSARFDVIISNSEHLKIKHSSVAYGNCLTMNIKVREAVQRGVRS
jgi:hypothetical protein